MHAVRGEDEAKYPREAAQPQPEQAQPFASRPNDLVAEEVESIYQFRHPDIDTEIWFVALGSGLSDNAGMNAFLAEHSTELRGAIIVNLEALGAGDLCLIEREGAYMQTKTSSRMKRYIRKASQATGVQASSAAIPWMDTASSVALKHGFQAMSIMGMDGTKPALFAQRDDSIESIDPAVLRQNAEFVIEVLKNI